MGRNIYIIMISAVIIIYISIIHHKHLFSASEKTIWQTYKTKELPKPAKNAMNTWINKNPEWKHELYDDSDIESYILKFWDERMYEFYKNLPIGVMKADLWRYLILTTHGGLYTDIDSQCMVPISKWKLPERIVSEDVLIIGLENKTHFCQWTIYSTKEHPAMKYICQYILQNYEQNGIDKSNPHFVHSTTGPGIWTGAIQSLLNMQDKDAEAIFKVYKSDPAPFNNLGIYIIGAPYFNGLYSKNLYGSQSFGDGYVRWTEQTNNK